MGITRRQFTVLGVTTLSSLPDGLQQQIDSETNDEDFSGVAYLFGTDRPEPSFFEDKDIGTYVFQKPGGDQSYLEPPYENWQTVPSALSVFDNANLPSDPNNGVLHFDNTRGVPAWYDQDHYEFATFVDDTVTSQQTVQNTTSETTVWNPTINAGSMLTGRVYQADLLGDFGTANNSSNFTLTAKVAGTTVASAQSTQESVTDAPWSIEFTLTVRDEGQSGTVVGHTRGLFNSTPDDGDSDGVTLDTTTATDIEFTVTWNEANTDNVVNLEQAHLKQMA